MVEPDRLRGSAAPGGAMGRAVCCGSAAPGGAIIRFWGRSVADHPIAVRTPVPTVGCLG